MERFRIAVTILWLIVQICWLHLDRLVRDGDEEGHVGAAELVCEQIAEHGWISFLTHTWWQDLGEYPPLYASFLGSWWRLFAQQPEDLMFRAAGIPLILCAAWAISETSRIRFGAHRLAFVLTLSLPLAVGLSRHSMIENLILPLTALSAWSLTLKTNHIRSGILFGFFVGLGLLGKQTFMIAGVGLVFLIQDKKILYSSIPIILLITLGWYIPQLGNQQQYIQQSLQANSLSSIFIHILTPFSYLAWDIAGPIICVGVVLSKPWNEEKSKPLLWWFVVSLLMCILIPKKYPRLMIGLCVPLILMLADKKTRWAFPIMIGSTLWVVTTSFVSIPQNPIHTYIDSERCPQVWMRPPFSYDFGLSQIAAYVQERSTEYGIYIDSPPQIPCAVQTTHDFGYHLEIYLRRHGQEHPIVTENSYPNTIHIYWSGPLSNPQALHIQ